MHSLPLDKVETETGMPRGLARNRCPRDAYVKLSHLDLEDPGNLRFSEVKSQRTPDLESTPWMRPKQLVLHAIASEVNTAIDDSGVDDAVTRVGFEPTRPYP